MFDVVTFGTATKDIFLQPKEFSLREELLCFTLGSKVPAEDINFSSGGGGTNVAATFGKQGFSVAYCGMVGEDHSAEMVLRDLKNYGVDCSMIKTTSEKPTNHSVTINIPEKDRTILVYRGASELYSKMHVDFPRLKTRWMYLAPFSSLSLFYSLLDFAEKEGIRVMINPGKKQIEDDQFKDYLKKAEIVLLNREEASLLIDETEESKLVSEVQSLCGGISLITKGKEGVVASSEKEIYSTAPKPDDAVDRTGAGDSFGSGFLS